MGIVNHYRVAHLFDDGNANTPKVSFTFFMRRLKSASEASRFSLSSCICLSKAAAYSSINQLASRKAAHTLSCIAD